LNFIPAVTPGALAGEDSGWVPSLPRQRLQSGVQAVRISHIHTLKAPSSSLKPYNKNLPIPNVLAGAPQREGGGPADSLETVSMNELQPDDAGATPATLPSNKVGRALSRLKRELTDDELSSPGAQKLLLQELERLLDENGALQSYRDKFQVSDKQLAVARESLKRNVAAEVVSGGCLVIGAAALGYAPAAWSSQPSGWIALTFGAVLVVCGIVAKAIKP